MWGRARRWHGASVPGSGRPPPQPWAARAAIEAGGCHGGCFRRPEGCLKSTRPEALTWDLSSSSSWLPGSELRSRPSSLCTNFSPAPSFPGGGGTHSARPGRPLAGREGGGACPPSSAPRGRAPGWRRGSERRARAGSPRLAPPPRGWGREDVGAPLRLGCRVPPSAGTQGRRGALPGTLLSTASSASTGD